MSQRDFRREPLRVLIVDDDEFFRESLRAYLELDERLDVIDVASGFRAALALALSEPVELAIVDVYLGPEDGFAVVDALHNLRPEIVSVMMSGLGTDGFEEAAIAFGAVGAVPKSHFVDRGPDLVLSVYTRATPQADAGAA